jgi:hypothetical protein
MLFVRILQSRDLLLLPVNFQNGLGTIVTIDCDPFRGAVDRFLTGVRLGARTYCSS